MTQEDKDTLIEAIELEKDSYFDDKMFDYGANAMANRIIKIVKDMKTTTNLKVTVNQNGKNCTTIENVRTLKI